MHEKIIEVTTEREKRRIKITSKYLGNINARKDHRSNNRDIETKGLRLSKKFSEKGQRK